MRRVCRWLVSFSESIWLYLSIYVYIYIYGSISISISIYEAHLQVVGVVQRVGAQKPVALEQSSLLHALLAERHHIHKVRVGVVPAGYGGAGHQKDQSQRGRDVRSGVISTYLYIYIHTNTHIYIHLYIICKYNRAAQGWNGGVYGLFWGPHRVFGLARVTYIYKYIYTHT